MGLISKILGLGEVVQVVGSAAENVSEVFAINKTKAELAHRAQAMASIEQFGQEFSSTNNGWFDGFINGLNRLPRPVMALGTVGLFVFAMASPDGFAVRMQGLAYIPDPLWWLLGAVVSFYFGARELHYAREANLPHPLPETKTVASLPYSNVTSIPDNAAVAEWKALTR